MAMIIRKRQATQPPDDDMDNIPPTAVGEEEEIAEPEPVIFDPDPPARYASMADAIKAARWELVHPDRPIESYVGTRDIWHVSDDELLEALPPDASYPISRAAAANRDIQSHFAGFLGAMTISTAHRFNVIASNRVVQAAERTETAEYEAWKANVAAHEIIHPLTLWVIVIAEMSVGKSVGLNLFIKHVRNAQAEETAWYKAENSEYVKAAKKQAKGGGKTKEEKESSDGVELIKPWKTVYMDDGPTEAALHYFLQYNPRGIGFFKDEGATLFSAADMYHQNGGNSLLDRLLPTYDGQGWGALRKPDKDNADTSVDVPRATVPIVCGIQPARLGQFVSEDDASGKATRLTVTRARGRKTEARYLTAEEINATSAEDAAENAAINKHIGKKIRQMLNMRMIGERRRPIEIADDDYMQSITPSLYSYPRHIGLSTEALVEYVNFRTYLKVSVENSPYGPEESPFVDRDCGRILRIAAMLHVWQHCERMEERGNEFYPMTNSAYEIARKPISLRTLQRAIIIVLYTMQTRRAEFARFQPKKDDIKRMQLAQKVMQHIAEHERYAEDIPYPDVKAHLARQFPEMKKWTDKSMGDFLKQALCLNSHRRRIGKKQIVCYRLADALLNQQSVCAAPPPITEEE